MLLGNSFRYVLGFAEYVFPVFDSEDRLTRLLGALLKAQGYAVKREHRAGSHRFDLLAVKSGDRVIVEVKNPRSSTNKAAGLALNQLISYLYASPGGRGVLILGFPVTSHVLKYLPALMERDYYRGRGRDIRLGVGFPITDGERLGIYVAENTTTWAKGSAWLEASLGMLPEALRPRVRSLRLKPCQFFDLIFYTLWLQNTHEWRKIGLETPLLKLLEAETRRRGYTMLENSTIKEPWHTREQGVENSGDA
jgi:Holliday junction resolvase